MTVSRCIKTLSTSLGGSQFGGFGRPQGLFSKKKLGRRWKPIQDAEEPRGAIHHLLSYVPWIPWSLGAAPKHLAHDGSPWDF